MIGLLAGKDLRVLGRSKSTLMVIFLPGIVLYTIFTSIFGGPAGAGRPFKVALVDEDQSQESRDLVASLAGTKMDIVRTKNGEPGGPPLSVESATEAIRQRGNLRVLLVIPKGFHESPNILHQPERHRGIVMYYDELEPIEAEIAGGLIQMAAGRELFTRMFGQSTDSTSQPAERVLVRVDRRFIRVHRMENAAKHTFLAGIVPMFLLFSAAGAARAMLESLKTGETRRLLAAPIQAGHLMGGSLLYMLVIQIVQCYVMYLYAWLVFDVKIWQIAGGLMAITFCTALATIGFGLFLGAICKTAEQLDAVGTMVILAMSAIGGSMVPRHIMPDWMQKLGLLTINGWAFDGFMSVIAPDWGSLSKSCCVLLGVAVVSSILGSFVLGRRLRSSPS